MKKAFLIPLFILAFASLAMAQEFTANIDGRVEDPAHAMVPGVIVTIHSPALQGIRSTVTDDEGVYRFTLIPAGTYDMRFELPGFKIIDRHGIELGVGKSLTLHITMPIATIAETVTVSGDSPVVDVEDSKLEVTVNQSLLENIPNQRDMWAVLSEIPAVTVLSYDVGGSTMGTQSAYRSYGVSGQNMISIDGVNSTEGTAGSGLYMDYGAMSAVQVTAAGNSAEVSVPGTVVNTVIKSGSNRHHGEAYADYEGPTFQASNTPASLIGTNVAYFSRYDDLDANLGGPFIKDKLWYFISGRDFFSSQHVALYDKPASQGGQPDLAYSTLLQNYTTKLNYQLAAHDTLTFATQFNHKFQPYRGADFNTGESITAESAASQNAWSEIGKVGYTKVIRSTITLEMSLNNFGYQFPSRDLSNLVPLRETTTGYTSGGYGTPGFAQQRRWHYNATLSSYFRKHDVRTGYLFLWDAPRFTYYGAPGPAGTPGHIQVTTTSGVPLSFTTDNAPIFSQDELRENALFVQDKYQATRKLTLNAGLRFDRYHSYYPASLAGLNGNRGCTATSTCSQGPFVTLASTPANSIAIFNTWAPRIAVAYDLFGNTKTAIKGSWGRFQTNTGADLATMVNPMTNVSTTYAWDTSFLGTDPTAGTAKITPAYLATLPVVSGGQAPLATVDPHLKDSYVDEYTASIEHQLANEIDTRVSWVRKVQRNTYGEYDRLHTAAAFAPVAAIDPGPNGASARRITIYDRIAPALPIDNYVTNENVGDNYSTFEFAATKRMSNNWQILSGFAWTKRNLYPGFSADPNQILWGVNSNAHLKGWKWTTSWSYALQRGFTLSGQFQMQSGEPYGRVLTVQTSNLTAANPARTAPLGQLTQTIYANPTGTYYLPTVGLTSVRIQKEITFSDQRLDLMMDVFNIFNSNATTFVNTNSTNFGAINGWVGGRVARFGVRYAF